MFDEDNKDQSEALAEVKKEVTITPEDCAAAFDFWNHFKIPPTPGLKEAMDAFAKDPTYENQENVKYWITKAIGTTDHEAFKDPLFEKIVAECNDVNYDMHFDRELEEVLSKKEE